MAWRSAGGTDFERETAFGRRRTRAGGLMPGPFDVLLVDDVPDLRLLVKMGLERAPDFRVVAEAEDGIEAVELAELHQPDLVILDISMPRQDGLETLPKLLAASPNSRVIVLSGFQAERLAPLTRELGAVAYLEKGVSPQELVAAARSAVGLPPAG